ADVVDRGDEVRAVEQVEVRADGEAEGEERGVVAGDDVVVALDLVPGHEVPEPAGARPERGLEGGLGGGNPVDVEGVARFVGDQHDLAAGGDDVVGVGAGD